MTGMDYYLKVTAQAKDEYAGGEGREPSGANEVASRLAGRAMDFTKHDYELPWRVTAVTPLPPGTAVTATGTPPGGAGTSLHGTQEVLRLPQPAGPPGVTLGDLTRLARHDLRHRLQQLHSEALEVRAAAGNDRLSAHGLLSDLDRMVSALTVHRDVVAREVAACLKRREREGG